MHEILQPVCLALALRAVQSPSRLLCGVLSALGWVCQLWPFPLQGQ
jgi:hypothetical protein